MCTIAVCEPAMSQPSILHGCPSVFGPAARSRTLLLNEKCFTDTHANRSVHRRDVWRAYKDSNSVHWLRTP